jgi:spore coat protein U-like protein
VKRILVAFMAFAGLAPLAWSFGDLEVYGQPQEITYSPVIGTDIIGTLEVRHKGPAVTFFVTLSAGTSGSFAARTLSTGAENLNYQLYDNLIDRNVIKDLSASPGPGEVLHGSAEEYDGFLPQTIQLPYVISIPAGQQLGAGTYDDSLTISLYTGTLSDPALVTTATLTISGPVANAIDLALVDPGLSFPAFNPQTATVMDFGELFQGATGAVDLLVDANCAFTLALESENSGVMAHSNILDPSTVPYEFLFLGIAVDLSSGNPVQVATSPGFRYPIQVTIGNLGTASSGTYQDVVTVTVTSQ